MFNKLNLLLQFEFFVLLDLLLLFPAHLPHLARTLIPGGRVLQCLRHHLRQLLGRRVKLILTVNIAVVLRSDAHSCLFLLAQHRYEHVALLWTVFTGFRAWIRDPPRVTAASVDHAHGELS